MTATDKGRSYDLAVIGSVGRRSRPDRATTLGKRVVMIERGTIGGTCVNTGCALQSPARGRRGPPRHTRRRPVPGLPLPDAPPVDMPPWSPARTSSSDRCSEKYAALAASTGGPSTGEATFVGTRLSRHSA